jgi:membrane protease YdiL (CAAX protease family)
MSTNAGEHVTDRCVSEASDSLAENEPGRDGPSTRWVRLTAGLFGVFTLFHGLADRLESDRGQAGLVVGAVVVLATVAAQRLLFGQPLRAAVRWLGLGRPAARGLVASAVVGMLLLLVIPAFAAAGGLAVAMYTGWLWLLPGLLAQAGVAEEVLFRGYLFHHVRQGRPFWRAAFLSMGPFAMVHLLMFLTLPWPVALAALGLAMVVAFPLAYLFELGGNTIWAPALLHFVIQGAVKVVLLSGESSALFPLVWMAACAGIPYLVFLVPRPATSQVSA